MKPTLIAVAVWLCFIGSLRAEEKKPNPPAGKRVAFSVDMNIFKPTPSPPRAANKPVNIFEDKRLPGAGSLIRKWQIVQVTPHRYQISGVIQNDNSGSPVHDAGIFLGNLDVDPTLRLMARTDEKGAFSCFVSNETVEQIQKAAEAKGITLIFTDDPKKRMDHKTLYAAHKYLYTGKSYIDLYRYEIPYDQAEAPEK